MTKSAFKNKELQKTSIFNKIFNIPKKSNAAIEINNLLSKKDIDKITPEEIIEIYDKYKIKSSKQIKKYLETIYESYFKFCLRDKKINKDELKTLKILKKLFGFSDSDVKNVERKLTREIFDETLNEFLKDDKLSPKEKKKLETMQRDLMLDKNIAKELYGEKVQEIYKRYLNEAIEDERLSPSEEKQLREIAKNLNITEIKIDDKTKKKLEKFKLFWSIENGNIPNIHPDINIQKNEKCYFMKDVELHELRRITKRINYGGPTFRVKIMKGVYYRAGSLNVQKISQDIMTNIDSGTIYLTNKRLIFKGNRKNTVIRLNKILDFECFKNGCSIAKETGKNPFYKFEEDSDLLAVILGTLLKDI